MDLQKSEAPLAGGAIANESAEQGSIVAAGDVDRKRFATLAAHFALRGHALIRSEEPGAPFYACRWGWIKPLASLEAAEHWLVTMTGRDVAAPLRPGESR